MDARLAISDCRTIADLIDCGCDESVVVVLASTHRRALARVEALERALRGGVESLRRAAENGYKSHDLGFKDSVSINTVDDIADELDAALQAGTEAQ